MPGCTELIKDGVNGYVVPLDMNFDVKKLLKIPKCLKYDNHSLEKWLDYLGDGVYIEKEEEEQIMKYLVQATDMYLKKNKWDGELSKIKGVNKYYPKEGEQWEVGFERMCELTGDNKYHTKFVEVIKEIKDEAVVTEKITEPIVNEETKKEKTIGKKNNRKNNKLKNETKKS